MIDDFLLDDELSGIGFASVGRDVRISRHALIFRPDRVTIGHHTRIDAFCTISAGQAIVIGRNVHLSAYVALIGRGFMEIGDFVSISVRCAIFSSNDDYSGDTMVNPTVPNRYRGVVDRPVRIDQHVAVGAGSTILAGVSIGESAVVGAMSLVREDVAPFSIVGGVPARVIGERRRGHRTLATRLLADETDPTST